MSLFRTSGKTSSTNRPGFWKRAIIIGREPIMDSIGGDTGRGTAGERQTRVDQAPGSQTLFNKGPDRQVGEV